MAKNTTKAQVEGQIACLEQKLIIMKSKADLLSKGITYTEEKISKLRQQLPT